MTGTYADIQARIADELARADLTSQIALEILTAILHYQRQRFWFNEGRATASTVAGQPNIAVPTDLLEVQRLDVTYGGHPLPLRRVTWAEYENVGGTDTALTGGPPAYYAYEADQFWFFPNPDGVYALTITYIKQLTTLSANSDTNTWMTEGESLIRHRARQSVKINYLGDPVALQMIDGEGYLSPMERAAYMSLLRMSSKRQAKGELSTNLPMPGRGRGFSILRG